MGDPGFHPDGAFPPIRKVSRGERRERLSAIMSEQGRRQYALSGRGKENDGDVTATPFSKPSAKRNGMDFPVAGLIGTAQCGTFEIRDLGCPA